MVVLDLLDGELHCFSLHHSRVIQVAIGGQGRIQIDHLELHLIHLSSQFLALLFGEGPSESFFELQVFLSFLIKSVVGLDHLSL